MRTLSEQRMDILAICAALGGKKLEAGDQAEIEIGALDERLALAGKLPNRGILQFEVDFRSSHLAPEQVAVGLRSALRALYEGTGNQLDEYRSPRAPEAISYILTNATRHSFVFLWPPTKEGMIATVLLADLASHFFEE
jgi:hypothetical protein